MEDIKTIIGKRVESEMGKRGLNRAQFGDLLGGISGQLIGRYIAGKAMPGGEFFVKWRDLTGYDLYHPERTEIISSTDHDEYEARYYDLMRSVMDVFVQALEAGTGQIDVELREQLSKILADRAGKGGTKGKRLKGGSGGKES